MTAVAPSPIALLSWGWRQLTSMRTAVVLLSLLALAAVPGSLLPQRNVATDPGAVTAFYRDNPRLAPLLDRLGLFEVYASPGFVAVYGLLLVSMTGCVLPRCAKLWRDARSPTPPAPRTLVGRSSGRRLVLEAEHRPTLDAVAAMLRRRHRRVHVVGNEVRAERGEIREIGNLVFHLSLLVLLAGIALGKLAGFEGRVAVIEGQSFTNTVSQFDEFTPAALTDLDALEPVSLTLENFDASFAGDRDSRGEPRSFAATVRWSSANGTGGTQVVRPNAPLDVNETKFFLTGHGYAPRITVTDGRGEVVFSGPTIFYPVDTSYASDGILKVPDARPQQLAFQGLFLPTAEQVEDGAPFSSFPAPVNPRLLLTAWTGDLGLDAGDPQDVSFLDTSDLEELGSRDDRVMLAPGEGMRLPDGLGTVRFDGVSRFANFQVAHDPGKEISLVAGVMLLLGLTVSLTVRRWRIWVRVRPDPLASTGLVTIDIGGRSLSKRRSDDMALGEEIDRIADALIETTTPPTGTLSIHDPQGART